MSPTVSPIPMRTRSASMACATTRSRPNARGRASSTCSRNCSAGMTDTLSEADAAERLAWLAKEIARHDRLYHDQDTPEISDAEYDALVRENRELETRFPELVRADSPSKRLGAAPSGALAKVVHARPMLSLENAFGDDEVLEFVRRVR